MPLITSGSRLIKRKASASYSWWQAAGTIPDGNIKEHVENPTYGQAYTGGTMASAWTLAIRTTFVVSSGYALDSQSGRFAAGYIGATQNGFYAGSWANLSLFQEGVDAVYFFVSSGSEIQAYRNNVAVGSPTTSAVDIGGTTSWRSVYDNSTLFRWLAAIPRGALYNIALDSTQRASLYTSMSA